jgi:hypothetical protein
MEWRGAASGRHGEQQHVTTKIFSGTYTSQVSVSAPTTVVSITATGYLEGGLETGVSKTPFTIDNAGTVNGIRLNSAGTIFNFKQVNGGIYDYSAAATTVHNYSTINSYSGIFLANGTITNGSAANIDALIYAHADGIVITTSPGSVVNFGEILAEAAVAFPVGDGVDLQDGGVVVNGGSTDHSAIIEGHYYGIFIIGAAGTVTNLGVIATVPLNPPSASAGKSVGVLLGDGGTVVNGAVGDARARISGDYGVEATAQAATVTNYGRIFGQGGAGYGVDLVGGGAVTNGSAKDFAAVIVGLHAGVVADARAVISNFGQVLSSVADYGAGILLASGGDIINGSTSDSAALIQGFDGVVSQGGPVINYASIEGVGGYGVKLDEGGQLYNGHGQPHALVEGYSGVFLSSQAYGDNRGTIEGLGGYGAAISLNSRLYNGDTVDRQGAILEGPTGANVTDASTLINFGTLIGEGGTAVMLDASSTLVAEAGSVFEGAALGGGGTLVLAGGAGTITGIGGGLAVVSGLTAATFTNFGTVEIAAGAALSDPSADTVSLGHTLIVDGALNLGATLSLGGAMGVAGTVAGAGALTISGSGQVTFDPGSSLTVAALRISGAAAGLMLAPGTSLAYANAWSETSGTVTVGAGAKLSLTGAKDILAGTLTGAGAVVIGGADSSLRTLTVGTQLSLTSGNVVDLQGVTTLAAGGIFTVANATLRLAAGGVVINGPGELLIGVSGTVTDNTLTNTGFIALEGGRLGAGQMMLVNQAAGRISGSAATSVIDTGASTITNAGTLASSTGAVVVDSAVNNSGLFQALDSLTFNGAVTGSGGVEIGEGGTADFTSTFNQNVLFAQFGPVAPSGTLELAHSQSYTGAITGFTTNGSTALDLVDIGFGGATKASYAGNASGGVLTVTDGTHTAKITLFGNYTASTFVVASDGHGGTLVHDPAKRPAAAHPFIAAMASLGASASAPSGAGADAWRSTPATLVAPPAVPT